MQLREWYTACNAYDVKLRPEILWLNDIIQLFRKKWSAVSCTERIPDWRMQNSDFSNIKLPSHQSHFSALFLSSDILNRKAQRMSNRDAVMQFVIYSQWASIETEKWLHFNCEYIFLVLRACCWANRIIDRGNLSGNWQRQRGARKRQLELKHISYIVLYLTNGKLSTI